MAKSTQSFLTATLDRKEGRNFVLVLADGQELVVPAHYFSTKTHEGDVIHLQFLTDHEAKSERTAMARSLLEEILNGQ